MLPVFPKLSASLAVLMVDDKRTIFAVIAGFLLMLMAVGLVFRRFSRNTSDYFRAGGKATWWLLGGSLFMQGFSAWTFTGAAGAAFQAGWSLPLMFCSNALSFLVNAALTAGWFRQLRCVTSADLIRLRFGPGMEQFVAWLAVFLTPLYGAVQLYGLAIFAATLLGVDVAPIIVVLGFVVLFYSALSGAWAVLAADFIQALVVMPISILMAALCLRKVGGLRGLFEAIERAGLTAAFAPIKAPAVSASLAHVDPNWFTATFMLAWFANNLINGNTLSDKAKFLVAKDGREARRASLLAAVLWALGLIIWFLPPIAARVLIPQEVAAMPLPNPVEGAYAAISIFLLPAGLVGLVLVGMCAATMSSLDSSLTSLAGNITQNIYPAICRGFGATSWEGRARFLFGKFVNLFCAVILIACALGMARFGRGGIFKILVDVMATVGAPIAVPMLLGLVLRRVPVAAPYVSIGAGLCVSLTIYVGPMLTTMRPWSFQMQVGAVVGVTAIAFLATRALIRLDAAAMQREEEFFERRDRPVDFAREIGVGNDGQQLRIIGAFGMALGAAILLLLLAPSSSGRAGLIVTVASATLGVGALMVFAGIRMRRRVGVE